MSKHHLLAALATLTLAAPASAAPAPVAPAPAPATAASQEVRLDHISIIRRGDHGSPVVLIPGLGSPRESWDNLVPALARDHRVYLVQVNGFGGDSPGANLRPGVLDGIVGDLAGFLAANKIGPVRLVGHSMGGLASLMFARAHPKAVSRVMVVDALPYFPVLLARGGAMPSAAQIETLASTMRDTVAARFGKPIDPATIQADVNGLALQPASRSQMAVWAAKADPRVTARLLYEDMSTDMRPALPKLSTPLTIVVPWTDQAFGKDRTLAFYRTQFGGAPNVEYVDIAESGHFVMLDQPARFGEALASFLR
jgi:pimeloyl-ACP methyl ester carboxylesterase